MERRKEFGPDEQHLLFLFFPDYGRRPGQSSSTTSG